MSNTKNYIQYTTVSWFGKNLLQNHSLDEIGIWQIKGEDPNCDMGGSHHQPNLGFVEGKLKDIIEYAVELRSFWTWGAGGSIVKIDKVKKIDTAENMRRNELNARKAKLQEELSKIEDELDVGGDAFQ